VAGVRVPPSRSGWVQEPPLQNADCCGCWMNRVRGDS
jgi:hypothetical protein